MVYFTCNACGEQIKKPQVEKHYTQKCRNCSMLTCIDCLKDFHGDEYQSHTQCMSEAQRYSKEGRSGWDPVAGQAKGEKKQQQWIGKLRELLETTDIDSSVRHITDSILDHDNIPRKRPKFVNFVKNIMRNKAQMSDIDKAWDLFSQALQPPAPTAPAAAEAVTEKSKTEEDPSMEVVEENDDEDTTKKSKKKKKKKDREPEPEQPELNVEPDAASQNSKKKKDKSGKKRKHEETESMDVDNDCLANNESIDEPTEPATKKGKFDWDSVICELLSKKGSMKLNKLKKKCLAEFRAQQKENAAHLTEQQIGAKFDKKLKKKKYKVLKECVSLAHPEDDADEEAAAAATGDPEQQTRLESSTAAADAAVVQQKDKSKQGGKDLSFNKWEAASLGNASQTDKFRRLMGIKTDKAPEEIGGKKRDDKKIFNDLEVGFQRARNTHFNGKGMGLGYS